MDGNSDMNIEKILIPKPQKIESKGGKIKIASLNGSEYNIKVYGEDVRILEGENIIRNKIYDMSMIEPSESGYKITLKVDASDDNFKDVSKGEAYYINIGETEAMLCGKDAAGAMYAAISFSQILYSDSDAVCTEEAFILDWPDFERRGHFIECRYGTEFLTLDDWRNFIDYMASMKLNTLTIGVYGCWGRQYDSRRVEYLYVPLKKYPEIKTLKNIKYYSVRDKKWVHKDNIVPKMYEEDFLGEIIAYAKRKNITAKPLFNSLGHNTLLPRLIPEISAKQESGEPTNTGFCTNNEKTYEVILGIYDDIIEKYLKPNEVYDIQIGLDEVGEPAFCKCPKCRNTERPELMIEYIIRICKHLKEKGMKHVYIYHDMLYHHFNVVNEELRDRFVKEGIYDVLVIDWWTYEDPKHLFWDKPEGVNNLFHSVIKPDTGYYNWSIPTENNENIRACAGVAKRLSFEGMETYSSLEYCYDKNYLTLADVSWNNSQIDNMTEFNERYAYRNYPSSTAAAINVFNGLHDIMKDETTEMYMNRACRMFDYYFYGYRRGNPLKVQNFPGDSYKRIQDDEDTYIKYLEFLKQKSAPAVDFFENNGNLSRINNIWLLTSKQYYCLADEYLTIYGLYKAYNAGEADGYQVIKELDRLICQREQLMLLAENVRIPANSYTYLRNMSIFRQFMIDLCEYFKSELSAARKPVFEISDLSYLTSETFDFLR